MIHAATFGGADSNAVRFLVRRDYQAGDVGQFRRQSGILGSLGSVRELRCSARHAGCGNDRDNV